MASMDYESPPWGKVPRKRRGWPGISVAAERMKFRRLQDMVRFEALVDVAVRRRGEEEVANMIRRAAATAGRGRVMKKRAPIVAELPEAVMKRLVEGGGVGFRIVMDKILTQTDVHNNNKRLSLPRRWLVESELNELLTPSEKARIDAGNAVEVVVDSNVGFKEVELKRWMMEKTKVLNLAGKRWTAICDSLSLKAGQFVQLWGFRLPKNNNKLAFTIVNLGFRPAPLIDYAP